MCGPGYIGEPEKQGWKGLDDPKDAPPHGIEIILKELFKKHLDISSNRPQAKTLGVAEVVDENLFEDHFYYNMEYFDWSYNLYTGQTKFYGPDAGRRSPFSFMGIFWGQDEKIDIIQKDFSEYIKELLADITTRVAKATQSLRKFDVPPGKALLSSKWNFLSINLNMGSIIGIPLHFNEDTEQENKIESESQYGRFVLFE